MARYGYAVYGESTYGSTAGGTTNLLWGLEIDWDGDGYFDGANEAQYMRNLSWRRGRMHYVKADGNGFEQPEQGYASFELINTDGRYDPNNTSSPLYPNVEPGKYVQIKVKNGESDTAQYIFSGKIETIEPVDSGQAVLITAYDGIKLLNEVSVTTELNTNIGTGAAVSECLSDAGWPSTWASNLDTGNETIPYWWVKGEKAIKAIDQIALFENGRYAVLGDGTFKFAQRSSPSASVITITQSDMLKDVRLSQPWEVVRNVVRVHAYTKIEQTTAALWTLNDKPLVTAGNSLELWGRFAYNNRAVAGANMINPQETTDYTMNTVADGTGTDLTASFTVTATKFAETVKMTITNNSASDGYVTLLKIRGNAIDSPDSTYVENDNSGTAVKRLFTVDTPWMQTISSATSRAAYLQRILAQNRQFPIFQMESQPSKQFEFDLLDRITVQIDKYTINTDYIVGGIEGQWLSDTGQAVLTTVYVEAFPVKTTGYWVFTTTFPTTFG